MPDTLPKATLHLQDNRMNSEKTIDVDIHASERWHHVPKGVRGEYLDIQFSARVIYYIELELIGD